MIARLIRSALWVASEASCAVAAALASLADALDDRGAHHGETIAEDEYLTRLARESRTGGK